jgi:hypothetical protein
MTYSAPSTRPVGSNDGQVNVANEVLTGPAGQDRFFADLIGDGRQNKSLPTSIARTKPPFASKFRSCLGPSAIVGYCRPWPVSRERVASATTPLGQAIFFRKINRLRPAQAWELFS